MRCFIAQTISRHCQYNLPLQHHLLLQERNLPFVLLGHSSPFLTSSFRFRYAHRSRVYVVFENVGGWNSEVVIVCGPLSGLKSNFVSSTTTLEQSSMDGRSAADTACRRRAAVAAIVREPAAFGRWLVDHLIFAGWSGSFVDAVVFDVKGKGCFGDGEFASQLGDPELFGIAKVDS
jgi:hypothetical protein